MQNFIDIRVNDFELDVYLIFQLYLTSDLDKNDNHQPIWAKYYLFDVCFIIQYYIWALENSKVAYIDQL